MKYLEMSFKNYNRETYPDFCDINNLLENYVEKIENNFKDKNIEQVGKLKTKKDIFDLLKQLYGEPNSEIKRNNGKAIIKDYRGIYTFAEKTDTGYSYLYTGITRVAVERINDHIHSKNKGSATWAYLMVKKDKKGDVILNEMIEKYHHKKKTKKVKDKLNILISNAIIKKQEEFISNLYVTFIPVEDNNYLLHILEPYIAAELKCYWNSFKTH